MLILGIESSCDDTGIGIVDDQRTIRANIVASQLDTHRPYGGVVPEIAARAHLDMIEATIAAALRDSGLGFGDLSGIAATTGPGLIGGVMVGAMTGKAIAAVRGLPFIAVNHLEAHALTVRLTDDVAFPYLLLLASGGHCQLLLVKGVGAYRMLGRTIDDAIGECFDKCAIMLGLGYPGGPQIEQAAQNGNASAFDLPRPMMGRAGCDFSFSGLKTAVRTHIESAALKLKDNAASGDSLSRSAGEGADALASAGEGMVWQEKQLGFLQQSSPHPARARKSASHPLPHSGRGNPPALPSAFVADMAASLQAAIGDSVADRTQHAFAELKKTGVNVTALVAAGGVASNQSLRARLTSVAAENHVTFMAPPPKLCTDNGVMVAWAGLERLRLGLSDGLDTPARPRWPVDEARSAS